MPDMVTQLIVRRKQFIASLTRLIWSQNDALNEELDHIITRFSQAKSVMLFGFNQQEKVVKLMWGIFSSQDCNIP